MSKSNLPANIPDAPSARLPVSYENARKAIEACVKIDECKDWTDKGAALASYARQAKDESLWREAQRIQLRAVNRYGELLKQFPRGDEVTRYGREGALKPAVTRTQAAQGAGLSAHQMHQGVRVASVPPDEFAAALASDTPPTVTALAARGTAARPAPASAVTPADRAQLLEATALLRQFAAFCVTHEPVSIAHAPGVDADALRGHVSTIDRWLDRFVTNLKSENEAA